MNLFTNDCTKIASVENLYFNIVCPMYDILQKSFQSLDAFREKAFDEFENIAKEIRNVQGKDGLLKLQIPVKRCRTKRKSAAPNLTQLTSNESSTSQTESVIDQIMIMRRSKRTLAKKSQIQPLAEKTLQNDLEQTVILKRSNRQASKKLKSQTNELVNLTSNADDSETIVRSSRVLRKRNSSPSRQSKVRKVNKQHKQITNVQMKEINQNDEIEKCILVDKKSSQGNELMYNGNVNVEDIDQSRKIEDNETHEIGGKARDNLDTTQSTVHFNNDHLAISTPISEKVDDEIKIETEGQDVLLPEGDKNEAIQVNDTKKMVERKEVGVLKENTNKVVKSHINFNNANKENIGYNTPERLTTPKRNLLCSVLSGSVKKKVEAFEKVGKNMECTPKPSDMEKKFERPMTRNARKALYAVNNNEGNWVKIKDSSCLKMLQETTNAATKKEKREDNAGKKKEELMKLLVAEKQRKREEKDKKVIAQREASQKNKLELALKLEKINEERSEKLKKKREERIEKKKQKTAQKARELEERRRQKEEEAARIARLKEKEQNEKNKAIYIASVEKKRMNMEYQERLRANGLKYEESLKAKELEQKGKESKIDKDTEGCRAKNAGNSTYVEDKSKIEQEEKKKDPEDYGVQDINEEDSTDEEDKPKREVPLWATKKHRNQTLLMQSYVPDSVIYTWFHRKNDKKPDIATLFPSGARPRPRTSSILWNSRLCFNNSIVF